MTRLRTLGLIVGVLGAAFGVCVTIFLDNLAVGVIALPGAGIADLFTSFESGVALSSWRLIATLVNGVFYGGLSVIVGVLPWWNRLRTRAGRRIGAAGLLLSAVIVIAFLLSLRWGFGCSFGRPYWIMRDIPVCGIACSNGAFGLFLGGTPAGGQARWISGRRFGQSFWSWTLWHPTMVMDGPAGFIVIPLLMPFLLVFVPSLIIWRRSRGFPIGHCQNCGYDLTGNVSGVCPECGVLIAEKDK